MLVNGEVTISCGAAPLVAPCEHLIKCNAFRQLLCSHLNIVPNSIFDYVSAGWVERRTRTLGNSRTSKVLLLLSGMLKVE